MFVVQWRIKCVDFLKFRKMATSFLFYSSASSLALGVTLKQREDQMIQEAIIPRQGSEHIYLLSKNRVSLF